MLPSPACVSLVEESEGLRLDAYRCPAGVLTVGWGHTGPDVQPGMRITRARAEELIMSDMARFSHGLDALLHDYPTLQSEYDAITSLAFNIGLTAFKTSSVLRLHRAGQHADAADSFRLWNKATVDGRLVVEPGLVRRRAAERALYLSGV